jgi:endonuclease-3
MPRENQRQRAQRAARIIALLDGKYPDARTALVWHTPLELLIATILSAQTTDAGVNIVTPKLFKKYRTARDWAEADEATLRQELRPTGFFRNKTKAVQAACRAIIERHGGQVPATMAELVELPGVARKTANVVLGDAFGRAEGIVVDRHVARVAGRLRLVGPSADDPAAIEAELMKLIPREKWITFAHQLVYHGRRTCTARKPDCAGCVLKELCPSAFKV